MIKVNFNDNNDGTYTINVLTDKKDYVFGLLEWDETQKLYVLWTGTSYSGTGSGLENTSDEGVSYYDDLTETEQEIKDEITDGLLDTLRN